ncbi:MAG: DUF3592 domain-containing protein [Candidatus Saccharimonadales bacterium]|nr:DUF3592 domain-containing protein [Candidatus Saccharimonadales bacterium]
MKFKAFWLPSADASFFAILSTLIVGVVAIMLGLSYINTYTADDNWIETQGTVKEFVEKKTDDKNIYLVTSVYSVDGAEYLITENIRSNSPPAIGDSKNIAYNPEDPNDSKVLATTFNINISYIFPVLGVYFVVIALISGVLKALD